MPQFPFSLEKRLYLVGGMALLGHEDHVPAGCVNWTVLIFLPGGGNLSQFEPSGTAIMMKYLGSTSSAPTRLLEVLRGKQG